jgi:adenylate cyclase
LAARLEAALGQPVHGPDDPVREDFAEMLSIGAQALTAGLPEETLVRTYRIFAENLRRIAEYQNELFVRDIMGRMLESGMSRREVLEASGPIRVLLVELSFRGVFLIHRRLLEGQAFHNLTLVLEDLLDEAGVRRRGETKPPAIVFLDLSGYTRLTEEEGDEVAATHATALAELVQREIGQCGGKIVKLLGDGVMMHFIDAAEATPSALRLIEGVPQAGLPAARAGIAAGPTIVRDGDYFGRTVNLASRIADYARPREVLVSEEVVDLTDRAEFREIGPVSLKGIDGPVTLLTAFPPNQ